MADAQTPRRRVSGSVIVISVLGLVLLLFAVLNTDEIGVDFIADTVKAPLILVIFLAALLGFVIGWFVGRRGD